MKADAIALTVPNRGLRAMRAYLMDALDNLTAGGDHLGFHIGQASILKFRKVSTLIFTSSPGW
jgi:hypothetical protein